MNSNILTMNEKESLLNLLFKMLKSQQNKQNMKSIDTKLLFRASEHSFDKDKFRQKCSNQGPTITIIHNEYDHVFGGYATESWVDTDSWREITDPTAFLFSVRPRVKQFPFKEDMKDGQSALYVNRNYGPAFGKGSDIFISENCGVNSCSFEFDAEVLCGTNNDYFRVKEYEIFSIFCVE